MPEGVTPTKKEKPLVSPVLDQLNSTLDKYQKTTKEFNSYQQSIYEEIRLLRNAGASKQDLKEYVESVTPLFDKRTEQYEKEVKDSKDSVKRLYDNTEFNSIKEQKQFDSMMKQMGDQFDVEQENQTKQNEIFSNMKESLGGMAKQGGLGVIDALLSPLKLITSPLQELTGFNLGESIVGGFSSLFGKKDGDDKKIAPRRSRLLQEGVEGSAAVYTVDKLKGEDEEEGLLDGLFEGLDVGGMIQGAGGLAGILGKVLPIAAIAASLIWAVVDAVAGIAMADEWGVSEVSAGIGGFLGGTGSGWEGAFANAGKWALMGLGVGFLAGGPVGAIIGGLIGAAVGGILGFIGGENLAKGFDAIGQWFQDRWNDIVGFFTGVFGEGGPLDDVWTYVSTFFLSIWGLITAPFIGIFQGFMKSVEAITGIWSDEETSVLDKILATVWEIIMFVPNMVIGWFGGMFEGIAGFFTDLFIGTKDSEGKRTKKSLLQMGANALLDIGIMALEGLGNIFIGIFKAWSGAWINIGRFLNEWIIQPVAGFFVNLWDSAVVLAGDIGAWLDEWIITPIAGFFDSMWNSEDSPIYVIRKLVEDFLITPISNLFRWIGAQASKIIDLGANVFDAEKSQTYEQLAIAGIDMGALLHATEESKSLSQDYDFWTRTDILKEENAEDLAYLLNQRGVDPLTIIDTTGLEPEIILDMAGFSGKQIEDYYSGIPIAEIQAGRTIDFIDKFASESVEDAIIRPDGTIIRTDPSDTIIATKNEPTLFDKQIDNQLKIAYPQNDTEVDTDMLDALYDIATILKEKQFNNVIQNNMGGNATDFTSMRMAEG